MTSNLESKLLKKLQRRPYRAAYVGEHVRRWVAHQIKAMREQPDRNWNQGEFAKQLGKPQSVVSRLEDPSYGKLTVQTLLDVASAYDVALLIRYVGFDTFLRETRDVSPQAMFVPSFEQTQICLSSRQEGVVDHIATSAQQNIRQYLTILDQSAHTRSGGDLLDKLLDDRKAAAAVVAA